MSRCATALLLCVGLLGFGLAPQPAAASKVVALVIGNESPENGLSGTDLSLKLRSLKDNLFSYGTESVIIEGMNLNRAEMLARVRKFTDGLASADLAIFYYAGLSAHNSDGSSYLVPQSWNGSDAGELVALHGVLERMREAQGARGLVFLDSMRPRRSATWQVPGIEPGLGSFSGEARPDRLQIALVDVVPGPTYAAGLFTDALLKRLEPESINPSQLASLVQGDVSFSSGNIHVPRLFGSVDGPTELKRLRQDEFAAKQKKCVASRESSEGTTTVAEADVRPMSALGPEPARLGGRFWDWFCPDSTPRARPPVASRDRDQDVPRKRVVHRDADSPSPRAARPARHYGGGGYGGGGAARAAASGAPVP